MKIAREIAEMCLPIDRLSTAFLTHMRREELESAIAAKLEPIRDMLYNAYWKAEGPEAAISLVQKVLAMFDD